MTETLARFETHDVADLVLVDHRYDQRPRCPAGERLDELFEAQCAWLGASGRGGQVAVDAGDQVLTYYELDCSANQLARYLLSRGARQGDRIALLFDKGLGSYVAMLAVLKIGAAYVPLDAGYPSDRLLWILGDAQARMVLSVSRLADRLADIGEPGPEVVFINEIADELTAQNYGRLGADERGGPVDDLAYVIYTSGSTGRPKGVAITHQSICNFVRVAAEVYGITDDDRVYQGLTIAFDFSVEEIWVPWLVGATLVPRPPGASLLGQDLHEFLTERGVTAMCCVPTLLATLDDDLPALRFLLVSGEACPRDLVNRWHRPGRRFLNVYGPTEATVTATWTELHPDKPVTIGVPLPTYSTVILDPDQPLALRPGEVGEIGIAGIGLATGYLNRDDLTEKAFVPDFIGIPNNPSGRIYRSGDLGRVSLDGEIEYLGRIDTQVKIRGYRIELTEIESVLLQVPGIAQAVVDTHRPQPDVIELVGYYSPRADAGTLDRELILTHLRDRLPSYMVPAYLEELAVIPMTSSDKADRKRLPPPSGQRGSLPRRGYVPPSTPVEQLLADALAGVLRQERVSVDSHFFDDLGADSLLMARFSTKVRKLGAVPAMSMRDIYLNPSVGELAAALGGVTVASAPPEGRADRPVVRGGSVSYVLTGIAQLLYFLAVAYLGAVVLRTSLTWIFSAEGMVNLYERALLVGVGSFVGLSVLPILAKWVLIGRWRPQEIRLWSLGYLRFWLVKGLIQVNPMALFAGSPLYVYYLRAMGAKIGKGVTIHSRNVPVATDLIRIGDGSVISRECAFSGYRAIGGVLQIGAVTIGRNVHVGEKTVLDIDTWMADGARLVHASALQADQWVPADQSWHGCPAEPAQVEYRTVPAAKCGNLRKVVYTLFQLSGLVIGPAVLAVLFTLVTKIPTVTELFAPGLQAMTNPTVFYLAVAGISLALLLLGIITGLIFITTVPRLLNKLITPGKVYPLYGFHYIVQNALSGMTNSRFFMHLFGDSSAVVHYLRVLGYDQSKIVQSGSNFGTNLRHDSPYLTKIGTGTMVSDALVFANTDYSGTSFRVSRVTVGERNYFGNDIVFPPDARTGENCLLATKVLVPIDGPLRENVGLLGAPAFEIPRSVERDSRLDHLRKPEALRRGLAGKNRHNTVTALLFLLVGWFQLVIATGVSVIAFDLFQQFGELAILAASLLMIVFGLATSILVERMTLGFRRLRPRLCSIYDPYFWRHERHWKLLMTPRFPGTPLNPLLWRLAGVRIGRRVFDDGCGIVEKTLVTIGDDAILNAGSVIQGHSLEEGIFKSDHIAIGAGATLGVHAFVHYGATMGDGAVLETDAFLMKGEEVATMDRWEGNPARPENAAPGDVGPESEKTYLAELVRRVAMLEGKLDDFAQRAARSGRRGAVAGLVAAAAVVALTAGAVASPLVTEGSWRSFLGGTTETTSAAAPDEVPAPDATPADSPETAFIEDYYTHLPGDVPGAFALLSPELQRAAGGLAGLTSRYQDIASVQLVDDLAMVNPTTITGTVRIHRRGGEVITERYQYTVTAEPDGTQRLGTMTRMP